MSDNERESPWEPAAIPGEKFHAEAWANINRAPHDAVSGVIYKRAMNVKRVRYEPADPAPEMAEPFEGHGAAVVRWLFSEQPGTEEGLLEGASFAFLHDTTFAPGAGSGMQAHPADEIFYVIAGEGFLHHHPAPGSPVITRPLRPGDALLVRGGEYHRILNGSEEEGLRLIVLGLERGRRGGRGAP